MSSCTSKPNIHTNQARNAGTEHRIRVACLSVRRFWGCSPSEALPPGYQPSFELGKQFIERISRLSRLEHHLATARRRLLDACHKRLVNIPSPLSSQLKIQRKDLDYVIAQYLAGQYTDKANCSTRRSSPQLSPDIASDDSLFNERFEQPNGTLILTETPLGAIDTRLVSEQKQANSKPTEDLPAILPYRTVPKSSATSFKAPCAPMTRPALESAYFPSGSSLTGDPPKQPPPMSNSESGRGEEAGHHHDPELLLGRTSTSAKASTPYPDPKRPRAYVKKTAVSMTGTPLSQKEQSRFTHSDVVPLKRHKISSSTPPRANVPFRSVEEDVTRGNTKQRPTLSFNHELQQFGSSVPPISLDKNIKSPADGRSNATSKRALPPTPIGGSKGDLKRRKTLSEVSSSSNSSVDVRITRTQSRNRTLEFLSPKESFSTGAKEAKHIPELYCHIADVADPDAIQYPVAVASSKGMYDRVENATDLEELRKRAIAEREARRQQQSGHDRSEPAFEKSKTASSEAPNVPRILLDEMHQAFENKLFYVVGLSRCSARRGDFNGREHDYMDKIHQEFIEGFRKTKESFEEGLIRLGVIERDDGNNGSDAVEVGAVALDSRICVLQEDTHKSDISRMVPNANRREEDFTASSPTIIDLEDYREKESTGDTEYVDDFANFMRAYASERSGQTIKAKITDQAVIDVPTATIHPIKDRIDDYATTETAVVIDREANVRPMYRAEPSVKPSRKYDQDLGTARNSTPAGLQAPTQPVHANDEQDDLQANKVEEILGSYSKARVLRRRTKIHSLKAADIRCIRNIFEADPETMVNETEFKRALRDAALETTKSNSAGTSPSKPAELKTGSKDDFVGKLSSQALSASEKGASLQATDSSKSIKRESVSSDVRRSNGPSSGAMSLVSHLHKRRVAPGS